MALAEQEKRVLFIMGAWDVGGVERVTAVLGNELAARGWFVTVACFEVRNRDFLAILSPQVHFLDLAAPALSPEAETKLRDYLHTERIRFVVNQWALPYKMTQFLRRAAAGLDLRLIATLHNIPTENGRTRAARNPLLRLAYKAASALNIRLVYRASDAYLLLSRRFEPLFRRFTLLPRTPKLHTLPNPLTLAPAPEVPKEKRLLYVGRLEETQKCVSRVIALWRDLAPRFPEWSLDIVGDGPDRAAYEAQAADLPRVTFHGFQKPAPFYARASLLLLTSDFEGAPCVIPEAQAAGCVPVILGSYPAAYDLVFGTNGIVLAPPFQVNAFARATADLMARPDVCTQMAAEARRTAADFSPAAIASRWETLFDKLLHPQA